MFFLFFMFENDRTHTLTHLNFGWQAPFQQDFPAFPFPTYYYSYSHQEGKKDWNCTATPFVFVLLCLMFVFLLRSAKRRFLTLGVGLVGRGFWIGFSFLIPSCTFFFTPLIFSTCLGVSMDFSQTPQHAVAAWMGVKRTCPLSFFFCFYLSAVVRVG